jgi:hypothetical protein
VFDLVPLLAPEVEVPIGRLNWWRAYQFPSIDVSISVESRSTSRRPSTGHERVSAPSPRRSHEPHDPSSTSHSPSTDSLVPVVLVGLRALSRDGVGNTSQSSPSDSTFSTEAPTGGTSSQNATPSARASILDEVDAISSSYVIIVLGGHYPPEHRYAMASGSENAGDLDQLWYSILHTEHRKADLYSELGIWSTSCHRNHRLLLRTRYQNRA